MSTNFKSVGDSIVVMIAGIVKIILWSIIDGITLFIPSTFVIGFFSWLFGFTNVRSLTLNISFYLGIGLVIVSIFYRFYLVITEVKKVYDEERNNSD